MVKCHYRCLHLFIWTLVTHLKVNHENEVRSTKPKKDINKYRPFEEEYVMFDLPYNNNLQTDGIKSTVISVRYTTN